MIYNRKFLSSVLLPYSKHFYFIPEFDDKSKQTSQINEVKNEIVNSTYPTHHFRISAMQVFFFLFLTNRRKKKKWFGIPCSTITLTSCSKCFTLAMLSAQIPISWTLVLTDKESHFLNFISIWDIYRKISIYNTLNLLWIPYSYFSAFYQASSSTSGFTSLSLWRENLVW